ncbi:nucleotidyltransferase domain-containing protein [Streptomyces sp. ISL-94]|uniref:nucleotidyltransferase domain-containing protein n=1 Tax=Streptomyces sp. ISL-94 TaxID=2819190 RepID=UPI001BECDCAD|nr:aminoglycoside adenylyltransferase [Streptomyces sp. ISL-94]MBT2479598.1 aminoglycoside adenylyltransferase [Streptomyces sp. ISL-94]
MDEARTERQLAAIEEALGLGVEVWLRGGWAMDFWLGGGPTRDHEDVDWFAWSRDTERLTELLMTRGYEVQRADDQQLDLARDGEDLSFALVTRDPAGRVVVAGGPWAGTPWPGGMLEPVVLGRLGRLECPVVSPAAQIEIKRMMPVWVPGRPRRPKDAEDVARLEAALAVRTRGAGRASGRGGAGAAGRAR